MTEGSLRIAVNSALENILEAHGRFINSKSANPALKALNECGIRRAKELGYPHRTHEMFTYVNMRDPALSSFLPTSFAGGGDFSDSFSELPATTGNKKIVFVDGRLRANLSNISEFNDVLRICSIEKHPSALALTRRLIEGIEQEMDIFAALNAAFIADIVILDAKAETRIDDALEFLFISGGSEGTPQITAPRLIMNVGRFSEINVDAKYLATRGKTFAIPVVDMELAEGSIVKYSQMQAEGERACHLSKTYMRLSKDSRFFGVCGSTGGQLVRHSYDVGLKGEGAEVDFNAISILRNSEQVHNYARVWHEAPNCTSNLRFRNIVNHKSQSSVDSTVIVREGAQLSKSDQLINNLMLSGEAKANSKPRLMIYADDVKCTHGSTVGQVSEEQLFYLKTRGLSDDVANQLLTTSFAEEIIGRVPFDSVKNDMKKLLLEKLEAGNDN